MSNASSSSLAEEIVQGKGYVLLPELFTPEEMAEARAHILRRASEQPEGKFLHQDGRSRLYDLLSETEIFRQMVQHPQVIEVIDAILGNKVALGGFSAHILYPGASNMGAHVDYPYFLMKPPYPATPILEVQAIWMMEDFTETNGAPLVAPETQKLCQPPIPQTFEKQAHKVIGKAGSVILSHGLCWHDTSTNHTDEPRVSVLGNYTPKYIRPIENPEQHISERLFKEVSPKLRQLLDGEFLKFPSKDE
ncbi:phytanoyl-CoA dioxygenase family protein [Vacuolonema iberomarrocanum]|uniref:phytanoyl-CoA dioxygenase family protein n=1 Tax=Vacuolonema iberomarrocanum TaxID=3454632 RepID=UPI001A0A8D7A|nr:phytanoyl-CoA dioxygenase family protein [filamentous cyanobacterium LEGE 07170]